MRNFTAMDRIMLHITGAGMLFILTPLLPAFALLLVGDRAEFDRYLVDATTGVLGMLGSVMVPFGAFGCMLGSLALVNLSRSLLLVGTGGGVIAAYLVLSMNQYPVIAPLSLVGLGFIVLHRVAGMRSAAAAVPQ